MRELFNACRWAAEEIAVIDKQMNKYRLWAGSSALTAVPRDSAVIPNNNPISTELDNLDYLERIMEKKRAEQATLLIAFEMALALVPNARDRTILRLYYVLGYTQAQVAEEIGMSDKFVREKLNGLVNGLSRRKKNFKLVQNFLLFPVPPVA